MNKALEILLNCRAKGQKRAGGINLDEAIAQLEAKDERIKELEIRAYHAEGYISDMHNEYPKHKNFINRKARSIVAMLFWEWRKAKQFTNSSLSQYDKGSTEGMKYSFWKAYKMLKDTK